MNVRAADNVPHSLVSVEVLQEIGCQGQQQFSSSDLISRYFQALLSLVEIHQDCALIG